MTAQAALKVIAEILSTLTFKLSDVGQAAKVQEALNVLGSLIAQQKD